MKGKAMARFSRQTRRNDSKIAGMYDLEERLGAGHFAEVKLARHVFTGERVAVKVIDKLKLDETAKHHLYQEVRCMKLVQHPNIVRLYEVIDTNTKLYLVQELGDGGDMYDYIMKHERGLSEEKARRYFRQILQAIDYCHKLYVVHRDLKPENVIFFKKFDVAKLTDFGFSNKFLPGKKLETACGSLAYSAPEILLGDSYDAPAVDVWSLGVILYMMVVGKAPFYEANESETLTMILDCKFEIPDYVSTSCKSLISRMIVRDASQRATLVDIMSDPWVLEGYGPINVTTVPLANQISLGVDQHNEVVQKMQLGAIADKETIKKCLESGSYNHVSATYYLLAEQVLRRLRWHRNLSSSSLSSQGVENKTSGPKSELSVSVEQASSDKNGNSIADRPVDDTSVEDISVDNSVDGEEPDLGDIDANLVTNRLTYHSTESIYDQVNSGADKQHDEEEMVGTVSVSMTKKQRKVFQKRRVAKVKSTPAFLNQISEERESDLDDSPRASPRVRRLSRRPVDVLKAQQKNRRPSPASSSGGRRSSSVSSSSEDDGDLDKKMRRLSTERCRRSPKRRSDDEGDGDDGEGGVGGSRGVAKKKMLSESSQTGATEQTNTETGSNSDVQGKCANACLLFDKFRNEPGIVRVNLNETHKCDSQKNEVGGNHMDTADVSWNVLDCSRWHLEKTESSKNDNLLREDKQPVRACVDNDCFNGGLKDRTVEECIVQDGILVRGIINDEITENESVKEGTRNSGNVGTNIRIADILGHHFAKGDFVEDGIVKNGFLENDIRKDRFADNSVSKDGNVKGVVLEDEIVKVRFLEGGVKENEHAEDGIMDIFDETEFTSNKCHKIASNKENLNFSSNTARALIDFKEHDNHANDGIIMDVFRLADVDGTSKETSLEMRSPAFRTLFNNPKVARVTSNCCRIL